MSLIDKRFVEVRLNLAYQTGRERITHLLIERIVLLGCLYVKGLLNLRVGVIADKLKGDFMSNFTVESSHLIGV